MSIDDVEIQASMITFIIQHPFRSPVLSTLLIVPALMSGPSQADPYLPVYDNADSSDMLTLQSDEPIRLIPDIDGDGRPETLTIDNGSLCKASVIHRSTALSDGALINSDATGHWRLFDSTVGCSRFGRTDVIGDINGDGRRDLVYSQRDDDSRWLQSAVIFTPESSSEIDISELDGNNGFVLEGEFFISDAGDVDGDGYDDFIVRGQYVYAGATHFAARYADDAQPDRLLAESTLGGGGFSRIGDLNGDGYEELLLGHINTLNQYYVLYGDTSISKRIREFSDLDTDGGTFMHQCAYSFGCQIVPVGDFDGDTFDDLAISFFGCGFANEAALVYGAAEGIPLRDSLSDYRQGEITRVADNISSGCLSGVLGGSPGDLDADGLRDVFIEGLDGLSSAAVLFGVAGERPAYVSVDALDGTQGARLLFEDAFRYGYLTRDKTGMDVDGDGFDDLIDSDDRWNHNIYETDDFVSYDGSAFELVLRGKPRELESKGPAHLVVEQVDAGWHVRWQPPTAATPASYRLLVDNETVANLPATNHQFLLSRDNVRPSFRLDVQAFAADDSLMGSRFRQVAERIEGEQLNGTVYGPTLVELVFNRQQPWTDRSMTYQIWRNCEFLALAQENAGGYWDSTAQPGQSYSYYLTPVYSRFHDVASQAALLKYPVLQRRSNSITLVTPGGSGNVDPTPMDCLYGTVGGDGDGDGDGESVLVDGLIISWSADGWHQVQSLDDYMSWCEGGSQCEVTPGTYVVINHATGKRIEPVTVTGDSIGVEVRGFTIYWPDDGWYQVQDAATYASLCEGGRTCEVPAGIYIVINHSSGLRWEELQVPQQSSTDTVYVEGQTIYFPDDGWYQVQNASTYESLCEGGQSCVVADGRYIVINHTSEMRYENVLVGSSNNEPQENGPGE